MKKIIRRSVFETNSSSSHSLSIKTAEEAKSDNRASFVITNPLEKIVWFFCVTAECEENFNGRLYYYCNGKSIEDFREETKSLIRKLYEENSESNSFLFTAYGTDFDDWDDDDIADFLTYVETDMDIYGAYCVFNAIADRKSVLDVRKRLVEVYSETEGISEEEALDRIDKNYCEYDELVKAIEDPKKHAQARWILRRVSMRVETDYKKAFNKRAVLEKYKKKFEEQELNTDHDCYSCTRFFSEGSLDECNCGFERYEFLMDEFSEFSDNEGMRKFLSPEIAVVGYER